MLPVNLPEANGDARDIVAEKFGVSDAGAALPFYEDEAKKRQIKLAGTRSTDLPANLPEGLGDARDIVAEKFGVSGKSVSDAC